ncbi:MAG: arsenate reductase (glutaredoxin) [Woeseia sp.]|nr:arsenate reductase (glutaredoxin) [Woeseia sp.]MBT8095461.1 arsenate reductase (glutaredoxin) [Woeseia sp.]NNE60497.1 arsenate reductase (glutaredoxin) [Woeseia sp.]NNL54804.1 arsenate reductase (glutaredoxin) [Woeseia sp.]
MTIRIYHNPRCSKSRKTLELLQASGVQPEVVAYLEAPPGEETLLELAGLLARPLKKLLRTGEEEFKAAQDSLDLDDDKLLARWLQQHPRVLERPIVVDSASGRAIIGRPPENVLELLPK